MVSPILLFVLSVLSSATRSECAGNSIAAYKKDETRSIQPSAESLFEATFSVQNLFEAESISFLENNEETGLFTKMYAKRRTLSNGQVEIIWRGTISESVGFATLRSENGRISGHLSTATASYELLQLPDDESFQIRKTNWEDFAREGKDDDFNEDRLGLPNDPRLEEDGSLDDAHIVNVDNSGHVRVSHGEGHAVESILDDRRNHRRIAEGDGEAVVDVLVLVTNLAMCQYARLSSSCPNTESNRAPIHDRVPTLFEETNNAFLDVDLSVRIRLVRIVYMPPSFDKWLPNNRSIYQVLRNRDIRDLRTASGADLVAVITKSGDYGGMAATEDIDQRQAYTITGVGNLGAYTFTHELGHLFGLHHDRENSHRINSYAHGYRVPPLFRTLMSYDCPDKTCPREPIFSSSRHMYLGEPQGDAAHDCARKIQETASTVANFMSPAALNANLHCEYETVRCPGKNLVNTNLFFAFCVDFCVDNGMAKVMSILGTSCGAC